MGPAQKNLTLELQPTRRKIMLALKKSGGMTATELSDLLGMTSMGVRRHLTTLERDGLVMYDSQQRGLGRPSYLYQLTERADNLFPKTYHILANELLGYLTDEEMERVFARRSERRIRVGKARLTGLNFHDKVAELARMMDEDGYFAEWQRVDDSTYFIREFNCAIHEVAYRYRQACATEFDFIRSMLPEADIVREEHIMNGASACSYRITHRP